MFTFPFSYLPRHLSMKMWFQGMECLHERPGGSWQVPDVMTPTWTQQLAQRFNVYPLKFEDYHGP